MKMWHNRKTRMVWVLGAALLLSLALILPLWGQAERMGGEDEEVMPIMNEYRVAPVDPEQRLSTVVVRVGPFTDLRSETEIMGNGGGIMTQQSTAALSKDDLMTALQNVLANELTSTAGIKSDTTGTVPAKYAISGKVNHFVVTKEREIINIVPYVSNVTNLFVGEPVYHTAEIQIEMLQIPSGRVVYDSTYVTSFETKLTPGPLGLRNLTPYLTVERGIQSLMDRVLTDVVLDVHKILMKRDEAYSAVREPIYETEEEYWETKQAEEDRNNDW